MCDKRSQTSQMVKSMVHGKPSRRDCASPTIYDIFDWNLPATKQLTNQCTHHHQDHLSKSYVHQIKQPIKNYYQQVYQQQQPKQLRIYQQAIDPQKIQPTQQYLIQKKKTLKPHQIKNKLYEVQQVHLKRTHSQQNQNIKEGKELKRQVVQKKLNQNVQMDRRIIQSRQKKIKQFKQYTRQLPNSAFTTYYGRPAFEAYGRCNSSSQLKSHNVMPHRGQNHPKTKQTYEGALMHGKKIKISDYLPRKPIQTLPNEVHIKDKNKQQITHLPLDKPDLVNHVRFSQRKSQTNRKQAVPTHTDVMKIPKRKQMYKNKKQKKNVQKSVTQYYNDGLKFMNARDNLVEYLEEKKIKDSKLAYKVTECYPDNTVTHNQDCNAIFDRPAGVAYEKGEPAENLIYRKS